ncbi:beta family protein [Photorhabdus luminescens subsp. luminescens]|uniref:Beta protein n=3 Tax=Photorhabdus TaxID=29487 RepID=A0A1G5Q2Z4_PHOLU|nr:MULTISPECIES: beta family protein [Photorhabdus]KMW73666.1 beta family protein [Photorhabdus luminescens subsp. luminescens]MCT8341957.1 beta family protein [Photorhabdus kleinii]MCW7547069.1 beta family protein [Photorhabdus aballayi]SCZ55761.1 Beta protein [Photorhabdus luminescens]
MLETISYIPILKTKRAEFNALNQLDTFTKSKIIPLLEIEPVPIDPDTDIPDKTYNEMLNGFERKILSGCDGIPIVFLDGILIEEQFIASTDTYPIENAIIQARNAGFRVIPVTSPTRSVDYKQSISTLVQSEICFRLTTTDLVNPQLITDYIHELQITPEHIDVIIDLRDMLSESDVSSGHSKILALGLINNFSNLQRFRSISLASGSFPIDLSGISLGTYSQTRLEWTLWQALHSSGQLLRNVIYSDYGIQHPDYSRLATRFPSVTASVRYTADSDFLVFRGQVANRYGYEQYGAHSKAIVTHPEYSGNSFSTGDKDIDNYAREYTQYLQDPEGNHKFGSPEVWRRIGQNHHITKVVSQLSNLYGL